MPQEVAKLPVQYKSGWEAAVRFLHEYSPTKPSWLDEHLIEEWRKVVDCACAAFSWLDGNKVTPVLDDGRSDGPAWRVSVPKAQGGKYDAFKSFVLIPQGTRLWLHEGVTLHGVQAESITESIPAEFDPVARVFNPAVVVDLVKWLAERTGHAGEEGASA